MTDYTITTNFGAKDSLPSGNAGKVIKGEEFTTEFTNIQTAVNTKADTAGDTFTGVVNFSAVTNFNADVAFDTNTMFVDVSENRVGIGTTSPQAPLHVHGDINLGNNAGADAADVEIASLNFYNRDTSGSAPNNASIIRAYSHSATGSGGYLTFATSYGGEAEGADATERMRIDASGNVGIGETNPADKFQVTGGAVRIKSDFPRIYLEDTNNNSDYSIINDNGKFSIFDDTNSLYRFALDASGNVGIGTHNPEKPLHINSGTGNVVLRVESTDTEAEIEFMDDATTDSPNSPRIGGKGNNLFMQTNGTERMRIDSSGIVLVGKTATNFGVEGSEIRGNPTAQQSAATFTRADQNVIAVNRLNSDGTIVSFRKDGTQIGSIGTVLVSGSRYFYIGNNSANSGIGFYATGIYPSNGLGGFADNGKNLGSSSVRWNDVYATNNVIQTSDRNEKQGIRELLDAEQRVATSCKGLLRAFKWNSAVEEKGDEARIHFGIIAQDLQDAFTAEGLDAGDYAMFINSTWTDEETGEERSRMGVRYSELLAFIISAI